MLLLISTESQATAIIRPTSHMHWCFHRDSRIIPGVAAQVGIIIIIRQIPACQLNCCSIDNMTLARWPLTCNGFSSLQVKGKWHNGWIDCGSRDRSWQRMTDNTQPCAWTYADLVRIKSYNASNNNRSINVWHYYIVHYYICQVNGVNSGGYNVFNFVCVCLCANVTDRQTDR